MEDGTPAKKYDLEERTAKFGEAVIEYCRTLKADAVNAPLITQLVKSAGSVGSNYCEADDSISRKEFLQKIGYCRKEARESKHWLRMLAKAVPDKADHARVLWKEARELHLIFAAISRKG